MSPYRTVFWIVGIAVFVCALIVGAIFLDRSTASHAIAAPLTLPGDWVRGGKNAQASLIEYSDFQCPACGAYEPLVEHLHADFPIDLKIIYRHFPLYQIHAWANRAAQAAEAAGLQGKFWEMHDLLFAHQSEWVKAPDPNAVFLSYAQQLKLDISRFNGDINSSAISEKIQHNAASGDAAGISGTPTFFLNGTLIQNPSSYEQFKHIIEGAISTTR